MAKSTFVHVTFCVLSFFILQVQSTLEAYEGDEPTTNVSPYFKIELKQNSQSAQPHVYYSKTNDQFSYGDQFKNRTVSWIDFGQLPTDTTTVTVTLLNNHKFNSSPAPHVLPVSYNINVKVVSSNQVSFDISGIYKHLSLEFTSPTLQSSFKNSLLIFVGELDPAVNKNDPNVLYFPPGASSIVGDMNKKNGILQFSKSTIYLSRGSWVYGKINVTGSSNGIAKNAPINILGHGVLDGSYFSYASRNNNPIDGAPSIGCNGDGWQRGFNINGMTCYNPSMWCVSTLSFNSYIRDYRAIAWYYNNDGMGMGSNSTFIDSFIRVNDDSIKISYGGPQRVERNVIWQLYNGGVFQLGWNGEGCNDCIINDNDVIHAEWTGYGSGINYAANDAVIDMSYGGGGATFNNLYIGNLRIDTSVGRILGLLFNSGSNNGVQIKNMTIENVMIRQNMSWNVINNVPEQFIDVVKTSNGNSFIDGLLFKDITDYKNEKILNDKQWNLQRSSSGDNIKNVQYE